MTDPKDTGNFLGSLQINLVCVCVHVYTEEYEKKSFQLK